MSRLQAVGQTPNSVYHDVQHSHLSPSRKISIQTTEATDDSAERHNSLSSIGTNCSSCRENLHETSFTELDDDEPLEAEATNDPPSKLRSTHAWRPVANRHPVRLGSTVVKAFQGSFDHMKHELTSENWLRLAIWWLIKSQTICRLLTDDEQAQQEDRARRSAIGWESDTNVAQVYVDLLKSVWILENLLKHGSLDLDDTQIRKLVTQLQRASNVRLVEAEPVSDESSVSSQSEESSILTSIGNKRGLAENLMFRERDLLDCRLDLLEDFQQIIEHSRDLPQPIDEAYPSWRWFEIDKEHCGYEHERVIHRTFVDAQLGKPTASVMWNIPTYVEIGFRNQREKPTSAPYLLLLWTSRGQSGLNISLCNHHGTLNLSRRLLLEDIEDHNGEFRDSRLLLTLKFDAWDAEICFLTSSDYTSFLELPLRFFSREQRYTRDPQSGEMAICQSSLISCDDRSDYPILERSRDVHFKAGRTSSYGLKLFETSTNNTWETTRRLVVFSPPDLEALNLRTESYWIPHDQVQILRQDQNVTIRWSDYQQVRKHRTDTREDRPSEPTLYYTYTYDAERPNKELYLKFINSTAARNFQLILQLPTEIPKRVTLLLCERNSQHAQEVRIYQLNSETSSSGATFAVCLTSTGDMCKSIIRYVYRDLDWILERDPVHKITFPMLTASMYTAKPSRLTHPPQPQDKAPEFKGVEQVVEPLEIETVCQHGICRIMQALTGWKLMASARASKVETPAKFGSQSHKGASVQLWQAKTSSGHHRTQLAIRFDEDSNSTQWVTAPLDHFDHAVRRDALTLTRLRLTRGYQVDSSEMTATTHQETIKVPAPKSRVIIHFRDELHLARFMNALPLFAR